MSHHTNSIRIKAVAKALDDLNKKIVICRYKIHGIIVDIIPTNDSSVGFNNKWYPDGFNQAVDYQIDEKCKIKILSAPYFIATKFEAFKGRGNNDGRMSQDFEDIVYILENRSTIWEEIINSNEHIKNYLRAEFRNLLLNPNYSEWIDAHVERGYPPATDSIINALRNFTI